MQHKLHRIPTLRSQMFAEFTMWKYVWKSHAQIFYSWYR